MDFALAKVPRLLECILCVGVWPVVIGQMVFVAQDAPACHGVGASPWSEQDRFEQCILLGVLFHSRALKAINGWDMDVVEDDLLGVTPGHRIVRLE